MFSYPFFFIPSASLLQSSGDEVRRPGAWENYGKFFLYCEMIFREFIKPQLTYTHSVPSLGESSRTLVAIVWTNCVSTTISTSCLQGFALIDIWDVKTNVVSSIQFSRAWIMEKLSPTLLYWKRLKWWNVGAVKCHRMHERMVEWVWQQSDDPTSEITCH